MNYREIIGPDELDWKVVPLDWKKIGKEELKMGTPMSKDGVEANDASCYGILMDDVVKGKHEQARVIVSGCVDFAKAEEYSGIKISAEAKKAIGKVWSQGGGGLTELPEGYPYKEQSEKALFEEVQVPDNQEYNKWVHTEHVPLVVGNKYKFTYNGVDYICTAADPYGQFVGIGNLSIANSGEDTGEPFVALSVNGMPLNIFFKDAQVGPGSFCLYEYSETIHTMAPEFLPKKVRYYITERNEVVDANNHPISYEQAKRDFYNVVFSPYGDDSYVFMPATVQDRGDSVVYLAHKPGGDLGEIVVGALD